MGALLLMLQLGLLITLGFSESAVGYTRPDNLDLECLNDFLTEMMCRLSPGHLESCSEYSLNVSRQNELFECDFKLSASVCECPLQVNSGFVVNENFNVNLLRSKNLLLSTNVSTTESIKPKKPAIVSVNQTQNGNFVIVWDTEYYDEPAFSDELIPELTYYVEGSKESKKTVNLTKGQKSYELIGRNLKSNSDYTVRARVKCSLNSIFSDYSDPYRFTTPSSLRDILKIIIPVICVILIISVFTIYYSCNKILTEWWEKVPNPKIATNFVKQVPNLLSFQNEISSVHLDSSKLVQAGEKIWLASSLVDVRGENSLNSLGKDGNSADVIYGQTGNESLAETSTENTTHWELVKESPSTNLHQIPMSNKYKNLKSNGDDCNVESECGNSSGISNKFYMFSLTDKFHSPANRHVITDFSENEGVLPAQAKHLDPMIQIDFDYSPCTGCPGSENTSPTQLTPSSNNLIVVPEYQSITEVDCTPTDQAFISSHNDVNLIMDKLIYSKRPQKISSDTTIIPVDNAYKDFQSLLRNSGEQQIIIAEPESKYLCGPPLHAVPGIQIDCSYHKV